MANTVTAGKSAGFAEHPGYMVDFIASPKRVRVMVDGEIIADSTHMMLMRETRHVPVYYFPLENVRMDLMRRTDFATHCPFKGEASYWALVLRNREIENVMWSYETPYDEKPELVGFGAFVWDRIDQWIEEDEEIFVHPRDPHKRIDTVPSSRLVRVVLGGEIVAESTRAHFLFETNMPTRYYIPKDDVRMTLLRQADSQTRCPYKGIASYYSAVIGGRTFEDIAWSYPDPVQECSRIKDLMCFYHEKVEAIHVDGSEIQQPMTRWSNM